MQNVAKLDRFFGNQLKSEIQDVLITKDNNGRYSLFGRYSIIPKPDNYYRVVSGVTEPIEFSQLKNAVTWCTLLHAGKHRDAKKMEELDTKLCSIDFDLTVHRTILRNKSEEGSRMIYINKIQEDVYKRRLIVEEINSYINSSKIMQARKFDLSKKPNFKFA
jgi:hypothetical protein